MANSRAEVRAYVYECALSAPNDPMCREICQMLEEAGLVGEGVTPDTDQAAVAFRKMLHQLRRLADQDMEFDEALAIFDSVVERLEADPADPESVKIRMELKTQVRRGACLHPPAQPRLLSPSARPDTAGLVHRRCWLTCVRSPLTGGAASARWRSSSHRRRSNASNF